MKPSAFKRHSVTRIISSDIGGLASDLAMAVWNRISHLPDLQKLHPRDYAELYDALHQSLKRYREPSK